MSIEVKCDRCGGDMLEIEHESLTMRMKQTYSDDETGISEAFHGAWDLCHNCRRLLLDTIGDLVLTHVIRSDLDTAITKE